MNTLSTIQQMMMEEYELTAEEVKADALLEDLGVDSLTTMEFLFLIEDKFKIIMNGEPSVIKTVGDIAHAVDIEIAKQQIST